MEGASKVQKNETESAVTPKTAQEDLAKTKTGAVNANEVPVTRSVVADDNPWKIPEHVELNGEDSDENVAVSALKALSDTDQAVIKITACLDTLDTTVLHAATRKDKDCIAQALNNATEYGILTGNADDYAFSNDKIQRDLYFHLFSTKEERTRQHLTIGRNLVASLSEDQVKEYHYTILRQFKIGEASISNQNERTAIATLCLEAGEHAVSKSDFALASLYLDFGISLLGIDCWKDNYDLTLALYNDAAEVEYSRSSFARVDELVSAVLQNAHSFRDSFRARASRIYSLSSQYQMKEAIDESLQVLNHLGEKLPSNPSRRHIGRELMKTWRLLRGRTNEMILRMPTMSNPDKLAALQILNLLFPGAYRTRPKLWGIIILRIVRLTCLYGTSPVSAIGFASYSAISSMITGNVEDSYRYGELALALVDKFGGREWIPRVYLGVYGHASSYKYYLRDAYPKFRYAHEVGLETGDIEVSIDLGGTIHL